ncbi:hypothetical protein [Silvanigrella sp.]|jgi:hypothetical protein|uniref:hypothetical protein n=1 Tax=Silvanigrella sp. TaxID=2024976 RepID=UPI0037CAD4E6
MTEEKIKVNIDGDDFVIEKLETCDSYDLYMQCLSMLAISVKNFKKETIKDDDGKEKIVYRPDIEKLNIEEIISELIKKLNFDYVVSKLKNITKNNIAFTRDVINKTDALTIIELFIHVIKMNCMEQLLKKDLGAMFQRIIGSSKFLDALKIKLS